VIAVPWVNLDDQLPEHPKVDGLSDLAFRLYIAGICYANRHLTDGFIPADRVRRLVPKFKQVALDELTDRAMWLPSPGKRGWLIRDYLDWNRSREQIEAERERKSKGGRKGAQARWGKP
jgi:hypothetical protein